MADENNLSNKEKTLLLYFKEQAKQEFPELDVSDQGAFMEMFGIPFIKLASPMMEVIDRLKLMQSLDNASLMTEGEMDSVARRYFVDRRSGQYARGDVLFTFDDIPISGVIQIPAGFELVSSQGYLFKTLFSVSHDEESLINYYNPELFEYQIPITVEADNPGSRYNISEGEIERTSQSLVSLIRVYNDANFLGGTDSETNEELAERIRDTAYAPNFGIERGWKSFAMSFDDVEDVLVAGFKHPLMMRDIIGMNPEGRFDEDVNPNVHWGGKIDLHIRGKKLEENVETLKVRYSEEKGYHVYLSTKPVNDVSVVTFASSRFDETEYDEGFFNVTDYFLEKEDDRETIRTLDETAWVTLTDNRINENDTVTINYRYNQLLIDMDEELYANDGRPPTSDVLLKETVPKYIHLNAVVKVVSILGLRESDREKIRSRVRFHVNNLSLGEPFRLSDFHSPIQFEEDEGSSEIEYINTPLQVIVTDFDENIFYYSLNQSKRLFLKSITEGNGYFKDLIDRYKEDVSISDIFDFLHLVTHDKITKEKLNSLSEKSLFMSEVTHMAKIIKRMFLNIKPLRMLSPSLREFDENEHAAPGTISVFEDDDYGLDDVDSLLNIVSNISTPVGETVNTNNFVHLTVYIYTMLYVTSAMELSADSFYEQITDLTKDTFVYEEIFGN